MATRQRAVDRGTEHGRRMLAEIGREIRQARRDRGLSLASIGAAVGCSGSEVSRIERNLVAGESLIRLVELASVVGLDLVARCYAGGSPIRDQGHVALLAAFASQLHPVLRWSTEIAVAGSGDQRSWDGVIGGASWRVGVEAEMAPRDWQALGRRLELKQRDGNVDGVILLVPDTRHVRAFLAASGAVASGRFPVPSRQVMARLRAGDAPGGSGIVVLRLRGGARVASDARIDAERPLRVQDQARPAHPSASALDRASGGTFRRL